MNDTPRHMAHRDPAFVAVCPDHQIRHPGTFNTVADAHTWAWCEHRCFGRHRVVHADIAADVGLLVAQLA